jgi:hypothetical protein
MTAGSVVEPTARLLWEACRRHVEVEAVRRAVDDGAAMGVVVDRAARNRVLALLWRALDEAGRLEALGERRSEVTEIVGLQRFDELLLIPHALALALGPLAEAGLEPVVLKGPTLAERYPGPGLRPMEDIDLLLPEYHGEAVRRLTAAGWRVARPEARDRYDTILVHEDAGLLALELHYGLEAAHERTSDLDAAALWARRVPRRCMGVDIFGLPPAEEIVMLCTHAAKPFHGFSRMVWIADLAMVSGHAAEAGRPVDWAEVAELARGAGAATAVAAALALARRLGVDSPPELFPIPAHGWRAAALQNVLDPVWPVTRTEISTFHLRYALVDDWRRRLGLLFGSGHGMPLGQRARFTAAIPLSATRRLLRLQRRDQRVTRPQSDRFAGIV